MTIQEQVYAHTQTLCEILTDKNDRGIYSDGNSLFQVVIDISKLFQ
jgi:hypothetical protein